MLGYFKTKISFSIFPVISGICLLSATSFSFAAVEEKYRPEDVRKLIDRLEKVTQESQQLRDEMITLKSELHQLKQQVQKNQSQTVLAKSEKTPIESAEVKSEAENMSEKDTALLPRFSKFPTVTTSPYLGLQSTYDGSDLVVNVSSMGEDLRLLRQRQALAKQLGGDLALFERRPVIFVSGKLEPTASTRQTSESRYRKSDINLDSTELDLLVEASSNAFGFISMAYDDQSLDSALTGSPIGRRISNSRIYLKRGFITLGNLDKYPLYFSAGQMYADFGRYSSNMISSTLPSKIGRTNARQLSLGYVFPIGLIASAYVFKGDSIIGEKGVFERTLFPNTRRVVRAFKRVPRKNEINEGGVNLRYKKDFELGSLEVGTGYISNVADAEGIQITRLPFPRLGYALTNELLFHRVPGLNAYGQLSLGKWKFVGEFVGVTRSFDIRNMGYNEGLAKPKAMQLELSRSFDLFGKPSLVGFSYDCSWESLAIGLPRDSYSLVFSTFPLKNIRFSLEYRYSNEYKLGTTAYMSGDLRGLIPIVPFTSLGGHNNGLIAQLGLYF